jgi:acyl-CoA reductase-like NAD-dependent aldehyde dehydrogenase
VPTRARGRRAGRSSAPTRYVPLILALRAVAPAIALGNTVVLKPASLTPIAGGQLLVELFEEAGAPPGVLNLVTGSGSAVGMPLAEHPNVALVHFTGSTEVGRQVAQIAGRDLKRTVLELGGDNAFVVLDDADVEQASACGAWASYDFQGQTCISASRASAPAGTSSCARSPTPTSRRSRRGQAASRSATRWATTSSSAL